MFIHARVLRGAAAFAMAACLTLPTVASAAEVDQTVTVTEENHQALGWRAYSSGTGSVDFAHQMSDSPIGTDSAEMTLGSGGMGVALLHHALYACNRLSEVGPVSYWTYVESSHANKASGQEAAPYVFFTVDKDRNGSADDVIVFEPTLNGDVLQNTWQQWKADEGRWHLAGRSELFTLSEYRAQNPDATLTLSDPGSRPDLYQIMSVVPDWRGFRGATEGYTVTLKTPSQDMARTYEFEDTGGESALEER